MEVTTDNFLKVCKNIRKFYEKSVNEKDTITTRNILQFINIVAIAKCFDVDGFKEFNIAYEEEGKKELLLLIKYCKDRKSLMSYPWIDGYLDDDKENIFLKCAVEHKNTTAVALFIEKYDINLSDNTIFKIAINNNDIEILNILLQGIVVTVLDDELILALRNNNMEIVKLLIDYGADIKKMKDNKSLLFYYLHDNYNQELSVCKFLVEQGVDVKEQKDLLFETSDIKIINYLIMQNVQLPSNFEERLKNATEDNVKALLKILAFNGKPPSFAKLPEKYIDFFKSWYVSGYLNLLQEELTLIAFNQETDVIKRKLDYSIESIENENDLFKIPYHFVAKSLTIHKITGILNDKVMDKIKLLLAIHHNSKLGVTEAIKNCEEGCESVNKKIKL